MLILSAALAQLSENTWCTGATQRNTWLLRRIRFLRRWLVDVNHIRFTQHHVTDSFSATVDNEDEDENYDESIGTLKRPGEDKPKAKVGKVHRSRAAAATIPSPEEVFIVGDAETSKPLTSTPCAICGRSFGNTHALRDHQRSDHNKK